MVFEHLDDEALRAAVRSLLLNDCQFQEALTDDKGEIQSCKDEVEFFRAGTARMETAALDLKKAHETNGYPERTYTSPTRRSNISPERQS